MYSGIQRMKTQVIIQNNESIRNIQNKFILFSLSLSFTDSSRRSLREKVARLRQERLVAEANLNVQENRVFQQQISQIRRQMLMQTIEGLKRSLEDQSATLKQTCLDSSILNDNFS